MSQSSVFIHIIGIEGAGTSALASMLADLGYQVQGSDEGDHFYADILKQKKIKVSSSYRMENLTDNIQKVIYSTAIKEDNPEMKEARRRKIPLLSYPEALAELFNQKLGLAVCGTHGKTTTSAFLAHILKIAGKDPQAIIGSKVLNWRLNSLTGKGEYFVLEADEYQNKLKFYNPYAVIFTSLDWDHPDFYPTRVAYKKAFQKFIKKIPHTGYLIYNNDEAEVVKVVQNTSTLNYSKISYGFHKESDYLIKERRPFLYSGEKNLKWGESFTVERLGKKWINLKINLLGRHNISNATAAAALADKLGIEAVFIKKALRDFQGTARRLEVKGKYQKAWIIDDYAHHPEEIKATLKALRDVFSKEYLNVYFHPHSFSRTKALLDEMAQSFSQADEVNVLNIYGSVREKDGEVNAQDLVDRINYYFSGKAFLVGDLALTQKHWRKQITNSQIIVTMGAGDVWKIMEDLEK